MESGSGGGGGPKKWKVAKGVEAEPKERKVAMCRSGEEGMIWTVMTQEAKAGPMKLKIKRLWAGEVLQEWARAAWSGG